MLFQPVEKALVPEPIPPISVSWKHWNKLHEFSPEICQRMQSAVDQAKQLGIRLELERHSTRDDEQTENGSKQLRSHVVTLRDNFSSFESYKEVNIWLEGVCFRFSTQFLDMLNQSCQIEPLKQILLIAPEQLSEHAANSCHSGLETQIEYVSEAIVLD